MIDFIANIKNKKNMTMGNMKAFVATSVLCVFFNGILIYGMKKEEVQDTQETKERLFDEENNEENKNLNSSNIYIKKNDIEVINNMPSLNGQQEDTIFSRTKKPIKKLKESDIILSDEEKDSNIFYNYKGHISLFCCCNLWNDKKGNQIKYIEEQQRKKLEEEKQEEDFVQNLLEKGSGQKSSNIIRLTENSENNSEYNSGSHKKTNINNNENNNVNKNNDMSVPLNNLIHKNIVTNTEIPKK